jgi:hypothetical protein
MAELDEIKHLPWCRCPSVGAIKRWLAYTPEEGRYPNGVAIKTASWGGAGSGSGWPDRHFDPVVREVAYRFALARVMPDRLQVVAEGWQITDPPHMERDLGIEWYFGPEAAPPQAEALPVQPPARACGNCGYLGGSACVGTDPAPVV